MSPHARKIALVLLAAPAFALAQAVVPPTAARIMQHPTQTEPQTVPPSVPQTAPSPIAVDPASKDLTQESKELSALRRDTVRTGEELKLLTTQAQIQQEKKKLGEVTTGTAEIPQLVGLEGTPGKMQAQFLTGKSLIVVREGGWVTPDWQVKRVLANGVEVVKRGSRTVQTILFGHEPIKSTPQVLQNSQEVMSLPTAQPVNVIPGRAPPMVGH